MIPELGSIIEGKITGITKFGAFVSLPEGRSGLVHISEVSSSYVSDINEYLSVGQSVKVMVISVESDRKISLSIKRALPKPDEKARTARSFNNSPPQKAQSQPIEAVNEKSPDKDFEDRLKKFMQDSDRRIADNKKYQDHKQRNRRR